jgi:transposase-like protein
MSMKLSAYARQVGVIYQTTYQWWRAGQSDTDDDLVDDLEAVSTSRAAASRAPQRHTPRGAHSGVRQAL